MTVERDPATRDAARPSDLVTTIYVTAVAVVGLGLTTAAVARNGIVVGPSLAVLALFAVLTWWSGTITLDQKTSLSFTSVILLAAMALVGPAGAGVVGIILGPLERGSVPVVARVFNLGMCGTLGVLGGAAFLAAGGTLDSAHLLGAWDIIRWLGIPILVAGLVQLAVNFLLVGGVLKVSQGAALWSQVAYLIRSYGPVYLGYGVVAFLMVVLWEPAGLGPTSVALVLAPLLVARWAYVQYGEEVVGHERALHVLVAAVEAKAPHLTGHSARVAELSGFMAEHLGLRAQVVADVRVAGMLHDIGLTTLPTTTVRGPGIGESSSALREHPARGAELLRGLSFLSGSLHAIAHHRDALDPQQSLDDGVGLPARVVGCADEFDLLTEVGTPDGTMLGTADAIARLRERGAADDDLVAALDHALSRRAGAPA